jgi:putative signal transducing protein
MNDMQLVIVKTFLNRIEAELAKGALEANGIEAIVRADDVGGTRPSFWVSGVDLLVRADDIEMARGVLVRA